MNIIFYVFKFTDGSSLTVPPNRLTCITLDFIKGFQCLQGVYKQEYVPVDGPIKAVAYFLNTNGVMQFVRPEDQAKCDEQLYYRCPPVKIEDWMSLFN